MEKELKNKELFKLLLERLILKTSSSRTFLAVGVTILLTWMRTQNFVDENNFMDGLKWVWTAFFATKFAEHGGKNIKKKGDA